MKKLLTILGSVAIVATTGAVAVACKTEAKTPADEAKTPADEANQGKGSSGVKDPEKNESEWSADAAGGETENNSGGGSANNAAGGGTEDTDTSRTESNS